MIWFFLIHLLVYLCILKHFNIWTERNICFYHLVSLAVSLCYCFVVVSNNIHDLQDTIVWCGVILGLQGVYSISFLELWSLTEGSYSISILRKILDAEHGASIRQLENIGQNKQAVRIKDLIKLKLIRRSGSFLELTRLGRVLSVGATVIADLSNAKMVE